MHGRTAITLTVSGCLLALLLVFGSACSSPDGSNEAAPPKGGGPQTNPLPTAHIADDCATCHKTWVERYKSGPHKAFADQCLTCHPNAREHMADVTNVRAQINFSLESCATCHQSYYDTYLNDDGAKPGHFGGSVKTSKYDEFPHYKYLMGGHGFTVEYTEERAHRYLLKDHIETQRKQTTTCLQCKSTPVAYYWNERTRGAVQFDKTMPWADVVERLRNEHPDMIDYGAGCTHCHDPHNGDIRLIRKGVIQAILERGTDPYAGNMNVIPTSAEHLRALLNERGPDGQRTAQARRLAGTLTCSQCHIEYVCGAGADGEVRDHVPWRKLSDIEAHYQSTFGNQQDWKHSITGLTGIKPQHPETEEYWGSVHYKMRMSCADCHMAKIQTPDGRTMTSHWLTSPLKNNTAKCAMCHEDVTKDVLRVQDAIYAQARQVEDKLNTLLQKIEAAQKAGSPPAETLNQAKALYMRALTWWEWTAVSENSMGAHNPAGARAQLQTADDLASQALQLLP